MPDYSEDELQKDVWNARLIFGIVITSEARNLLLFAVGTMLREQQIPHGLKAVRDDKSRIAA
jgi:hypothetical protein